MDKIRSGKTMYAFKSYDY